LIARDSHTIKKGHCKIFIAPRTHVVSFYEYFSTLIEFYL
jgi:hypothetical protein